MMKKISIIKFNCIIISAIIIIILAGCATPRSVRPTGSYLSSQRQPVRQEYVAEDKQADEAKVNTMTIPASVEQVSPENHEAISYPQEDRSPIAGLSDEPETLYPVNNDPQAMPSFIEQLRMINAGQMEMNKDIREVKNLLGSLDERLTLLEKNNNPKKQDEDINNNEKKSNIILSNEAIAKKAIKPKPEILKSKTKDIPQKTEPVESRTKDKPPENDDTVSTLTNKSDQNIDNIKNDIRNNDYSEAIKKLTKMVNEVKDPVTINIANFYLGESHFGLGQYDKAVEYYKMVLENGNSEKNDDAQIMIAEAQLKLGNVSDAKEAFQKFVKSYPKSEFMPKARKMLQQI